VTLTIVILVAVAFLIVVVVVAVVGRRPRRLTLLNPGPRPSRPRQEEIREAAAEDVATVEQDDSSFSLDAPANEDEL
jgi:hypothetical protein